MRVIGAAGRSGRHLSPLVNIGGGCGGQAMLVAERQCISMGCQIESIRVLHQKLFRASSGSAETKKTARFWRDREAPMCISALQDSVSA